MMVFFYAVFEGIRDILSHKFRSILTVLGVVLGTSALMTMNAITEGMAVGMREHILATGKNLKIEIRPDTPPPEQTSRADTSPGLTYQDAMSIRSKIPMATWVSPMMIQGVYATNGSFRDRSRLQGSTQGLIPMEKHAEPMGRFFTDLEIENKARVCVLGGRVYEKLFPNHYEDAIGSTIRLNGKAFQVVGIFPFYLSRQQKREIKSGEYQRKLARKNKQRKRSRFLLRDYFSWKNDAVVIPISTFQELFKQEASANQLIGDDMPVDYIQVGLPSSDDLEDMQNRLRSLLLIRHKGIEDFRFKDWLDGIERVEQQVASARLSGTVIAGIGLVVGGVGIANIMLASIADRIREIGIRRAIGARASDIFLQVMMEALLLALIGGIAGIATGYLIVLFLSDVAQIPEEPILTWVAVAFSFVFALISGFLAGIYPAAKASALSPVEALRYN